MNLTRFFFAVSLLVPSLTMAAEPVTPGQMQALAGVYEGYTTWHSEIGVKPVRVTIRASGVVWEQASEGRIEIPREQFQALTPTELENAVEPTSELRGRLSILLGPVTMIFIHSPRRDDGSPELSEASLIVRHNPFVIESFESRVHRAERGIPEFEYEAWLFNPASQPGILELLIEQVLARTGVELPRLEPEQ